MKINSIKERIAPTYNTIKKRSAETYKYSSEKLTYKYQNAKDAYQAYRKQYKGLPALLAAVGFMIPLPLTSVLGFLIGVGIVKTKMYFKNKKLNKA